MISQGLRIEIIPSATQDGAFLLTVESTAWEDGQKFAERVIIQQHQVMVANDLAKRNFPRWVRHMASHAAAFIDGFMSAADDATVSAPDGRPIRAIETRSQTM